MSKARITAEPEKEERQLQIPAYIRKIEDRVDALYKTYHTLRDRLAPVVITGALDTVAEDQTRAGKTPLANELEEFIIRLDNLNDNFLEVIEALEI